MSTNRRERRFPSMTLKSGSQFAAECLACHRIVLFDSPAPPSNTGKESGHNSKFLTFVQKHSMKFNKFVQTYKHHIQAHLKPRTVEQYSGILRRILVPRFSERELTDIRRTHVVRLHLSLGDRRTLANRMLAVGRGLYKYANLLEEVPDGINPFAKIKHFEEPVRERFLEKAATQVSGSISQDFV